MYNRATYINTRSKHSYNNFKLTTNIRQNRCLRTSSTFHYLFLSYLSNPIKPSQTTSKNKSRKTSTFASLLPLQIQTHPSPHLLPPIRFHPKNRFPPKKRILSSFLGSSTHTSARVKKKKKKKTSAQISAHRPHRRVSPSTSGLARCKRQHSKEHSRVIKRGKWSPGGEARLFEAVSSKGNLVMTSAEPCLCTRSEGRREREREERLGGERDYIIQP